MSHPFAHNHNLRREELALKLENIGIGYCVLAKAVRDNQPHTAEAMNRRIVQMTTEAAAFAAAPDCNIHLNKEQP